MTQMPSPPYQTVENGSEVNQNILQGFKATKPWVRLFSVLGFISVGFMILAAFFILAASMIGSESLGMGAFQGIFMFIIYVFSSLLYFFPSLLLWKYGTAIENLTNMASIENLEKAVDSQRAFWKLIGIFAIIWIVLAILGLISALILGVFAAAALV